MNPENRKPFNWTACHSKCNSQRSQSASICRPSSYLLLIERIYKLAFPPVRDFFFTKHFAVLKKSLAKTRLMGNGALFVEIFPLPSLHFNEAGAVIPSALIPRYEAGARARRKAKYCPTKWRISRYSFSGWLRSATRICRAIHTLAISTRHSRDSRFSPRFAAFHFDSFRLAFLITALVFPQSTLPRYFYYFHGAGAVARYQIHHVRVLPRTPFLLETRQPTTYTDVESNPLKSNPLMRTLPNRRQRVEVIHLLGAETPRWTSDLR